GKDRHYRDKAEDTGSELIRHRMKKRRPLFQSDGVKFRSSDFRLLVAKTCGGCERCLVEGWARAVAACEVIRWLVCSHVNSALREKFRKMVGGLRVRRKGFWEI
ncbi:hypothetical protein PanWU01x14_261400, partial [Parasponia andersonii]